MTRDKAVELSMVLARRWFAQRGDRSEMHLTETELAAMLAIAMQRGYQRAKLED